MKIALFFGLCDCRRPGIADDRGSLVSEHRQDRATRTSQFPIIKEPVHGWHYFYFNLGRQGHECTGASNWRGYQ